MITYHSKLQAQPQQGHWQLHQGEEPSQLPARCTELLHPQAAAAADQAVNMVYVKVCLIASLHCLTTTTAAAAAGGVQAGVLPPILPNATTTTAPAGQACGPAAGARCGGRQCCSKSYYCGETGDHCIGANCLAGWGNCGPGALQLRKGGGVCDTVPALSHIYMLHNAYF